MRTSGQEWYGLSTLQVLPHARCVLSPEGRRAEMEWVLDRIMDPGEWSFWTDSSGKADPPPDYFSNRHGLMMEHMRVDDHEFIDGKHKVNPQKRLEGELFKRMDAEMDDDTKERTILMFTDVTDLPRDEDHNYRRYVECFDRVVREHIRKIPLYRENHPDKKLVFLIVDESSAYIQLYESEMGKDFDVGDTMMGDPHIYFLDRRLMSVFWDADIDYVIWYAQFKQYLNSTVDVPDVVIFDPRADCPLLDYDVRRMRSCEE